MWTSLSSHYDIMNAMWCNFGILITTARTIQSYFYHDNGDQEGSCKPEKKVIIASITMLVNMGRVTMVVQTLISAANHSQWCFASVDPQSLGVNPTWL